MKEQKFQKPGFIILTFLSWFGSGLSPKAPGTLGSLASIPLIYFLGQLNLSLLNLLLLILFLTLIAIFLTEYVQKKYLLHDPQWIVIDEVIGMLVSWSFIRSLAVMDLVLIFLSFRFFDIIKIWPASYFDKKIKHGAGTIMDDVISGVYAGIFTLYFSHYFNS